MDGASEAPGDHPRGEDRPACPIGGAPPPLVGLVVLYLSPQKGTVDASLRVSRLRLRHSGRFRPTRSVRPQGRTPVGSRTAAAAPR
jgi:hypothetical protein